MKDLFNKLKIPTLLGLTIIVLGIVAGVFLALKQQIIVSQASPSTTPQNITLSNISDTSVTISYETSTPVTSFITYGQVSPDEITILDERDQSPTPGVPKTHLVHYFTIKNLLPKTTYQYKVVTGKSSSDPAQFTTATPPSSPITFSPIIGTVLDPEQPLEEGLVYLTINDAITQSSLIKSSGNFLIPISQIRKTDLSDNFPLTEDTLMKIFITSSKGQTNVSFRLKDINKGLPILKLGQDLDLTTTTPLEALPSTQELEKYDLNNDGKINAADNSIILQNLGKNPKNKKADLNNDGLVDQKDLDLMVQKIKGLGFQ